MVLVFWKINIPLYPARSVLTPLRTLWIRKMSIHFLKQIYEVNSDWKLKTHTNNPEESSKKIFVIMWRKLNMTFLSYQESSSTWWKLYCCIAILMSVESSFGVAWQIIPLKISQLGSVDSGLHYLWQIVGSGQSTIWLQNNKHPTQGETVTLGLQTNLSDIDS